MPFALILLQKGSAGIGGIPPVLMPDVPLTTVALFGALNPVTIAVAVLMGRALGARADQRAKIGIAAFAAAIAGSATLWLGTRIGLPFLATPGRAAGGIFVAGFLASLLYAGIGYWSAMKR
jgi:hypothetical protein